MLPIKEVSGGLDRALKIVLARDRADSGSGLRAVQLQTGEMSNKPLHTRRGGGGFGGRSRGRGAGGRGGRRSQHLVQETEEVYQGQVVTGGQGPRRKSRSQEEEKDSEKPKAEKSKTSKVCRSQVGQGRALAISPWN